MLYNNIVNKNKYKKGLNFMLSNIEKLQWELIIKNLQQINSELKKLNGGDN